MTTYDMRRLAAAVLVGAALAACSSELELPDRGHDTTRTEENRLAELLGRPGKVLEKGGTCRARLIKQDGVVSYAWAHCEGPENRAASVPVRVQGEAVQQPGDGVGYSESVKRLFPKDVADAILDDPDRLKP